MFSRAAVIGAVLGVMSFAAMPLVSSAQPGKGVSAGKSASGDSKKKKDSIKPYDKVVTDDFSTKAGLFIVHTDSEKVLYEIPPTRLDEDMLWEVQLEETQAGYSWAGMPVGERVVRWEKRGKKILLRDVKYQIRADTDDPISIAVKATNVAPIIAVFPIKAWGKDQAPVIDVTTLFTSDHPEFSAADSLGVSGMDSKRTFLSEVKTFPTNIETKVLATYKTKKAKPGRGRGFPSAIRKDSTQSGVTAMIHHSMIMLPAHPMKPRTFDSRVGYFTVGFADYADDSKHDVETVRYITRWRLEKKDPKAELSEPKKQIVWYVGRGVPDKWRPFIKAGIEDWQTAFEAAGFKNAIIAKDAPTKREDPDWDAEDARYSTIRWLPSAVPNAFGPHVSDPRTGEILEADVRMFHNVMKLARDWYFVQASPNDERAQKFPLPDDLMGELIQFVVSHEVGHSLGFPHNMKASSSYSIEQLRDPEWTKKNGTAPSIMDYARFNYVAQPGDGAALLPGIGPYDRFATEWGYRQFDKGADEKAELAKIVHRQLDEPMFLFGNPNPGEDPTQQTEDLGADTVAATTLGLANLKRVAGYLVDATSKEGEDYSMLDDVYGALLGQWAREMGHVVNVVGGVKRVNFYFGDADQRYFPLDTDKQREAVAFLLDKALSTPDEAFVSQDILGRLEATGSTDRMLQTQTRLLRSLLSDNRIKRMAEVAQSHDDAYTPAALFSDVSDGLWSELDDRAIEIDVYRRNLQRTYVSQLSAMVKKEANDSDSAALARAQLESLGQTIESRLSRVRDDATEAHLKDIAARIDTALDTDD